MKNTAPSVDQILEMVKSRRLSPGQGLQLLRQHTGQMSAGRLLYATACQQDASLRNSVDSSVVSGRFLLFDIDEVLYTTLSSIPDVDVVLVQPGQEYAEEGTGQYRLHPSTAAHYRELMSTLHARNQQPDVIVHRWSHHAFTSGSDALQEQLATSFYSLFFLAQALFSGPLTQQIRLFYLYAADSQEVHPVYAAVTSFAKSLNLEHSRLRCTTLALHAVSPNEIPGILFQELQESETPVSVSFNGTQRAIPCLQEVSPQISSPDPLPLKKRGVYLITGGLGGLGQLFAKYLATHWQARLLLTGRSAPGPEQERILQVLNRIGAQVVYHRADVTDPEQVAALVREGEKRFQRIDGVIHSAGCTRDALLRNKTVKAAAEVLAPKLYGTLALDQALQNIAQETPLDFFVLFSSLAAVIGNAGQCDYAYANGFLDHFAAWRESQHTRHIRHTLSINWPLWLDGGMHMDADAAEWLKKHRGLDAMPNEPGLHAFEQALAMQSASTDLAVFYGNIDKISQSFHIERLQGQQSRIPEAGKEKPVKTSALQQQVSNQLLNLCSELLKVDVLDLDVEVDFSEYGVDSIMMMRMLNRLEELLGQAVEPDVLSDYPTIERLAAYLVEQGLVPAEEFPEEQAEAFIAPASKVIPAVVPPQAAPQASLQRLKSGQRRQRFIQKQDKEEDRRIAVIGMACRFPGSPSPELFWNNLLQGRHLVTEVPSERWSLEEHYAPPEQGRLNTSCSRWGGYISGIDLFDPGYFGIPGEDAIAMDPQHRVLLMLTQELLDRSGYRKEEITGQKIGVYLGGAENFSARSNWRDTPAGCRNIMVNIIQNMMAARIADYYNLTGPALTLDTACSSSLVALHQACQSILNGEAEAAIAGGIELLLDPFPYIAFTRAGVLSPDDRCYVFDEKAKGLVLGEGAGLVLLKRYDQALAAGDPVLGLIQGSAVNNDGHTMGLTVPNLAGQKEVIGQVLTRSGIHPEQISYVEAHGTGTLLGDPIEVKALTEVYAQFTKRQQYCAIGSVKSNIGHLGHAAGIAGCIKVLLALQQQMLPPTLHCDHPHPRFNFPESPFYPLSKAAPWPAKQGARYAAVSSFGFGGTNCHLVLQDVLPPPEYRQQRQSLPLTPMSLQSCRTGDVLPSPSVQEPAPSPGAALQKKILAQVQAGKLTPEQAAGLTRAKGEKMPAEMN
jgi:polyketide synthase PksN